MYLLIVVRYSSKCYWQQHQTNGRGFLRRWEDASATCGQIDTLYSVIISASLPCFKNRFIDFILFVKSFSWYHPQATRHIAESLLQNAQDGAFLLPRQFTWRRSGFIGQVRWHMILTYETPIYESVHRQNIVKTVYGYLACPGLRVRLHWASASTLRWCSR